MTKWLKDAWLVIAAAERTSFYAIAENPEFAHYRNEANPPPFARARFKLTPLPPLEHPQSRFKNAELTQGEKGHRQSRGGTHGEALDYRQPREEEREHFAKEIAHFLEHSAGEKKFTHLILCAEPHFLGLLHQEFSHSLKQHIHLEVQKDYHQKTIKELEAFLEEWVQEQ